MTEIPTAPRSATIAVLVRRDGTAEFDFIGCGARVLSYAHPDARPLCGFCRELGTPDESDARRHLDDLLGRDA